MTTARHSNDGVNWNVELPDRSYERFGGSRPKAIVHVLGPEGEEQWAVPTSVGNSMSLLCKDCGGRSDSRAELAYEVKRASRRRLTGKNDFQKIVRYLCGKGYPMNISMDVAKQILKET